MWPCDELATCPGCTLSLPNDSWDRLQIRVGLSGYRKWMDGQCIYMNIYIHIYIFLQHLLILFNLSSFRQNKIIRTRSGSDEWSWWVLKLDLFWCLLKKVFPIIAHSPTHIHTHIHTHSKVRHSPQSLAQDIFYGVQSCLCCKWIEDKS